MYGTRCQLTVHASSVNVQEQNRQVPRKGGLHLA